MENLNLSEIAYNCILDRILTSQLKPGASIVESSIAKELKMSRTPVREAVLRLVNQGIVTYKNKQSSVVAEYTEKMIYEVGTLRLALDQLAIKLAFMFANYADLIKLQQLAQNCIDAYKSDDVYARRKIDCDYHLELARIGRNKHLVNIQNDLYLKVLFIQTHYIDCDMYEQVVQHKEIADALIERNYELALSIGRNHLNTFYNLDKYYPIDIMKDLKL